MATKKAVSKAVKKKAPVPRAAANPAGAGLKKSKRATLMMSEADFDLMRWTVLPEAKLSWQDMLSQAVNAWLEERGYQRLESIE